MNVTHSTADEYASFALGALDSPDQDLLRAHLRANCRVCVAEMKEALEFWYVFAALTERTQDMAFPEPTPMLRDRVLSVTRRQTQPRVARPWFRIAAAVLLSASTATMSWTVGRYEMRRDVSAAETRVEREAAAVRKLESENNSLKNLVEAARNAPAVFPGRDAIVSVKDPYLLRDLQRAKQTQAAAAEALKEERAKAAGLEKRLSQTTSLLAAATHDKEETDRQYRKADAALRETVQGASRFSEEIAAFHTRVQDLEAKVAKYRAAVDAQNKGIEKHLQLVSLLQSQNVALVQLHGTVAGSGVALVTEDARLAFLSANLAPARTGCTYQLWLIRDKGQAAVSAGTFNGGSGEMAPMQLSKQALAGVKSMFVTEEPAGGSAQPTGAKLMTGTRAGN